MRSVPPKRPARPQISRDQLEDVRRRRILGEQRLHPRERARLVIEQPRMRGDQRQQARRQRRRLHHVAVDVGGRLAPAAPTGSDLRRGMMPTSPGGHAAQRRRPRVRGPRLGAGADRLPGVARRRRRDRARRRQLHAARGIEPRDRLEIRALGMPGRARETPTRARPADRPAACAARRSGARRRPAARAR